MCVHTDEFERTKVKLLINRTFSVKVPKPPSAPKTVIELLAKPAAPKELPAGRLRIYSLSSDAQLTFGLTQQNSPKNSSVSGDACARQPWLSLVNTK